MLSVGTTDCQRQAIVHGRPAQDVVGFAGLDPTSSDCGGHFIGQPLRLVAMSRLLVVGECAGSQFLRDWVACPQDTELELNRMTEFIGASVSDVSSALTIQPAAKC
jgi:hypothetical protein